jgi:hypothetical protein
MIVAELIELLMTLPPGAEIETIEFYNSYEGQWAWMYSPFFLSRDTEGNAIVTSGTKQIIIHIQ